MRRASGCEAKSPRLLIAVDVMGSPGSFKFLVNDGDPVSTVIATTLRNYSKEGRIPVLGTHVDDFLLYSTGGWGTSGQYTVAVHAILFNFGFDSIPFDLQSWAMGR